jgi:DNA replication protein DnaC
MTTGLSAIIFTSDIARLTENFTGRQWVFDDIDRWLRESEERFFILTGEPGVGKSAIAARLTQFVMMWLSITFVVLVIWKPLD